MHLSEFSVKKPVAVSMLFIGVILLGIVSLSRLSVDLLPNLAYPRLTVWTTYRDVGPQEIEEFLTKPIEEILVTVPGILRVFSTSREGISLVTTEFLWGTNMDFAMLNVREKLDQLRWTLPRAAGRPTIIQLDPNSQPIMALSVSGPNLVQIKDLTRNVIKRRLEQLKGVALAEVTGGLEREIQVDVQLPKLTALGLTLPTVTQALANANYSLPGGTIKQGLYRYSLRTLGEFQSPADLEAVVIWHTPDGIPVYIRDVATVTDGFAERQNITRFNGQESIGLLIQKEAGANTIQVTALVKTVLAQLRQEYPALTLVVAYEQARFIAESVNNLLQDIIIGGLLAFLVLFFFIHDFRHPIYIALTIPVSIITSFTLLYFLKISINIMSLGGLALAVGMLVDSSIVVLENIFRYQEAGLEREPAAILGAREVALPITAGTFTTIVVFLPVIYVYGVAGQLFREQALTVTISLLASLIVALTLLPLTLAHFFKGRTPIVTVKKSAISPPLVQQEASGIRRYLFRLLRWLARGWDFLVAEPISWLVTGVASLVQWIGQYFKKLSAYLFKKFDICYEFIINYYEKWLHYALKFRSRVIVLTGILLLSGIIIGSHLTRELMPRVDSGEFTVQVTLPPGYSLQATANSIAQIEQTLLKLPEVQAVFTTIGLVSEQFASRNEETALNQGTLQVRLKPQRSRRTAEVMQQIRQWCAALPDVTVTFKTSASVLQQVLGTAAPPLAIKIQGPELALSLQLAQQVQTQLQPVAGLKDLHLNFEIGRPEFRIAINREAVGRYGLSVIQVAEFIQDLMQGEIATYFKDFDRRIEIWVRPTVENRDALADLLNAQLLSQKRLIPLRSLITVEERRGPTEVQREDQTRQVVLVGEIQGRGFSAVIQDINQQLEAIPRPDGYRIFIGGEREELQRSFRSLSWALLLSIALIYMVLAAQFESLLHPFIILLDIPITICLTMLVLSLTGMSINVITMIGVIVLAGVAVNDSIIKVDFINQERRRGTPMLDAIYLAGQKRFRPIMMSMITTVLGLLPMALGLGAGAELQQPLAITILGGIILSTFVSLIVVPVIYTLFERQEN